MKQVEVGSRSLYSDKGVLLIERYEKNHKELYVSLDAALD